MGAGRKSIIFLYFFLSGITVFIPGLSAQKVRIGLFDNLVVNTLVFHCTSGTYDIYGDTAFYRKVSAGELVYISLIGGNLVLMDGELEYGIFDRLEFQDISEDCLFRLKLVDPAKDPRNYHGRLEVSLFHETVQLVNELSLDEYLAGVVETEGGPVAEAEYYKAQAVLCRSYTIKNWNRHPGQDFNLCDNTHCQAFHGVCDNNVVIHEAVLATHGLVLANKSFSIVSAIFHSNSGGETQRASDIWSGEEEHLQAVLDPFSEGQRNAKWEKTIGMQEWKQYISKRMPEGTRGITDGQLMVKQDHRNKYFTLGRDSLLLSEIRRDMNLRSSFFSMEMKGDSIFIRGKGYGHGVGMSQEGAMEMAGQGFSFSDILRFYFYNVQVAEISDVPDSELPEEFR